MVKAGVIIGLLLILYCLGSGAYFLVRDQSKSRMVKALTWRVLLSLLLFIFLFIAHWVGWLHPHAATLP